MTGPHVSITGVVGNCNVCPQNLQIPVPDVWKHDSLLVFATRSVWFNGLYSAGGIGITYVREDCVATGCFSTGFFEGLLWLTNDQGFAPHCDYYLFVYDIPCPC